MWLYNAFTPLILRGSTKKVVCISSGMADFEMARNYDLTAGALYSASKAAMNVVTAKYSAQYRDQGVLFIGICPGMVDVGKLKFEDRTKTANSFFFSTPLSGPSPKCNHIDLGMLTTARKQ